MKSFTGCALAAVMLLGVGYTVQALPSHSINKAGRDGIKANQAPVANFTVSPSSGDLSTVFSLDGTSSYDADGAIVAFQWRFGDGTVSKEARVTHQYKAKGTYSVTLKVTDDAGATGVIIAKVAVSGTPSNLPPVAQFTVAPKQGDTSTTFSFDGRASSDPDGAIVKYKWSFGDGVSSTGSTIKHRFAISGTYRVVLAVTDDKGTSSKATKELDVK